MDRCPKFLDGMKEYYSGIVCEFPVLMGMIGIAMYSKGIQSIPILVSSDTPRISRMVVVRSTQIVLMLAIVYLGCIVLSYQNIHLNDSW